MKKVIRVTEAAFQALVDEAVIDRILQEDVMPPAMHPSTWSPEKKKATPPPLPGKKPGGPPNLKGFKADCNMMADAAGKVKQILDAGQGNTKEALRWLDKVVQFATSAKKSLGQG